MQAAHARLALRLADSRRGSVAPSAEILLVFLHACSLGCPAPVVPVISEQHQVNSYILIGHTLILSHAVFAALPLSWPHQEILDVEQVTEENQGMELNGENVDQVRMSQEASVPVMRGCRVDRAELPLASSIDSSSSRTIVPFVSPGEGADC